ncbi:TetR/AcrR family transcriptional regulator [Nocardioides alcanivorans]|uniref:TetR/AcrR family transcriptional regulator n=1 Tax=Nocardioides alcanivorans TaxID=2897352 RepID=UPI001F1B9D1A|nr:TetR/AcrR family transcriptional regulator [Nocardioides alcanivorans]
MPAPTESQQARRDQGPVTDRGAQRRAALLVAAREVFERKGFVDTKVSDIAKEAHVSHGTFYTYFDTKEAIFKEVSKSVIESMLLSMATPVPTDDFHARIKDSVRRFVHAYRPHATMIGLMEQVGTFSPELRDLRLDMRETFVSRTQRGIGRLVEAGLTDADIDVEYTAESLGAMLEYVCYVWFSLDRQFDEDRLIETLAGIWEKVLAPAR